MPPSTAVLIVAVCMVSWQAVLMNSIIRTTTISVFILISTSVTAHVEQSAPTETVTDDLCHVSNKGWKIFHGAIAPYYGMAAGSLVGLVTIGLQDWENAPIVGMIGGGFLGFFAGPLVPGLMHTKNRKNGFAKYYLPTVLSIIPAGAISFATENLSPIPGIPIPGIVGGLSMGWALNGECNLE